VLGLGLLSTTPSVLRAGLPTPRVTRALLGYGLGRTQGDDALADLLLAKSQRHRAREVAEQMKTLAGRETTSPVSYFAHVGACLLHDTVASLHRITAPTVIVAGAEDAVIPPRGSRILADGIPNASLEILRDAGHGVPFTDPEVVERMLATLEARAPCTGEGSRSS
jgi:pimeloyl-ACP methyl ester carboxylesterase